MHEFIDEQINKLDDDCKYIALKWAIVKTLNHCDPRQKEYFMEHLKFESKVLYQLYGGDK